MARADPGSRASAVRSGSGLRGTKEQSSSHFAFGCYNRLIVGMRYHDCRFFIYGAHFVFVLFFLSFSIPWIRLTTDARHGRSAREFRLPRASARPTRRASSIVYFRVPCHPCGRLGVSGLNPSALRLGLRCGAGSPCRDSGVPKLNPQPQPTPPTLTLTENSLLFTQRVPELTLAAGCI